MPDFPVSESERALMRSLVAVCAVLLAAACAAAEPPNIVLIVSDDPGYNDLGVLGDHIITPNLAEDVGEKNNLAQTLPEKAGEMQARFEKWLKEMEAAEPRRPFRDF